MPESSIQHLISLAAYQKAFRFFSSGILWVNEKGVILGGNKKLAEYLQFSEADLVERTLFEIDPHLNLLAWKKVWKSLKKKNNYHTETEYITSDGLLVPVKVDGVMLELEGSPYVLLIIENLMESRRLVDMMRVMANAGQVGSWELDLVKDELSLAGACLQLLGLKGDMTVLNIREAIRALYHTFQASEWKELRRKLKKSITEGAPFEAEFLIEPTEGQFVRIFINGYARTTELDQTIKVYGSVKDISRLENRTEDLYLTQFTIDHSNEMIFWVRPDGSFAYVNQAVCERLGYTQDELLTLHAEDIAPEFIQSARHDLWDDLRKHRYREHEFNLKTKKGEVFPVFSTFNHIRFKGQEYNCAFSRDWTDKKMRDQEILLAQKTLESAGELVFWVDEHDRIRFANQAVEKMTAYAAEELKKRSPKVICPDIDEWSKRSAADGIETEIRTKAGESVLIELSSRSIEMEGETIRCYIGRNITERKRREADLEAARQKVEELSQRLKNENVLLREEISSTYNFNNIITSSPRYRQILGQVAQVAQSTATVMIQGETGTGKELLARAIHSLSDRADAAMIKVNCAALPETLIESELFGHEKGAFTGAVNQKKGRFELADGGTLFLDEIGEMPLELQVNLLRVLQEGTFERIGGTKTLHVDVRVIAATNRNLEEMVHKGTFREDLFYRLNVFPIHNIPLRERKEDIPVLANYFTKKYAEAQGKKIEKIPQADLDRLQSYEFPGNIRELENMIERAVILTNGKTLNLRSSLDHKVTAGARRGRKAFLTFEEMQRQHIVEALERTGWRITGPKGAGRLLGLNDRTLASKMRKLGIRREDYL
jgi:PAS domain S-box-containing protein